MKTRICQALPSGKRPGATGLGLNARTLALFTFVFVAAGSARADQILSGQFENNDGTFRSAVTYSGVEPNAVLADAAFSNSNVWNALTASFFQSGPVVFTNLLDSTGTATGVSLGISHIDGGLNDNTFGGSLADTYLFSHRGSQTFEFSGLAPNQSFTLFLYAFILTTREAVFTVGSSSFDTIDGMPYFPNLESAIGFLTGTTSATGTIDGTWAASPLNDLGEIDWAGFQLDVASPVGSSVPEPGTLTLLFAALSLMLPGAWRSRLVRSALQGGWFRT